MIDVHQADHVVAVCAGRDPAMAMAATLAERVVARVGGMVGYGLRQT